MEQEQYMQAVMLGQVLTQAISTEVEPFSGNALYYPRRTETMEQYKTVKEVCALTGLTGKHLYYFHHENVVRAAYCTVTGDLAGPACPSATGYYTQDNMPAQCTAHG